MVSKPTTRRKSVQKPGRRKESVAAAAKLDRQTRQTEQQKLEIIRGAARCFAHAGYEATTMRAIAQECGYTASSLYTYFQNKTEIFQGLVEQVDAAFLQVFAQKMPTGLSFSQRLELLFMRLLAALEQERDAVVFSANIIHGIAQKKGIKVQTAEFKFVEALTRWFQTYGSGKELSDDAAEDVAFFVWGIMHGFFLQWLGQGAKTPLADKVPIILRLILGGIQR